MDGSSRRGRLIVDPSAMAGNRAEACGGCQTKRKRFPTVTRLGDAYSLRVGRNPGVPMVQPPREVFTCGNVMRFSARFWGSSV